MLPKDAGDGKYASLILAIERCYKNGLEFPVCRCSYTLPVKTILIIIMGCKELNAFYGVQGDAFLYLIFHSDCSLHFRLASHIASGFLGMAAFWLKISEQ